jgi:hypothetical protein
MIHTRYIYLIPAAQLTEVRGSSALKILVPVEESRIPGGLDIEPGN